MRVPLKVGSAPEWVSARRWRLRVYTTQAPICKPYIQPKAGRQQCFFQTLTSPQALHASSSLAKKTYGDASLRKCAPSQAILARKHVLPRPCILGGILVLQTLDPNPLNHQTLNLQPLIKPAAAKILRVPSLYTLGRPFPMGSRISRRGNHKRCDT